MGKHVDICNGYFHLEAVVKDYVSASQFKDYLLRLRGIMPCLLLVAHCDIDIVQTQNLTNIAIRINQKTYSIKCSSFAYKSTWIFYDTSALLLCVINGQNQINLRQQKSMDASTEDRQYYQPQYSSILPINNYGEQEQQPQSYELPIDQIQAILSQAQSITNRRQIVLIIAVNYLQDKCSELTNANSYLNTRIQDLLEQLSYSHEAEISEQIAHGFLQSMEQEIDSYRRQFQGYRERQLKLRRQLYEQRNKLEKKIEEIEDSLVKSINQRQFVERQRDELAKANLQLEQINQQLNQNIANLEDELENSLKEAKYNRGGNNTWRGRKAQAEFQNQLEQMIGKLVLQLQNERKQKVKILTDCKSYQKTVLLLQKQIAEKNSKIYELQMNIIRSNRSPPKSNNTNQTLKFRYDMNKIGKDRQAPQSPRNNRQAHLRDNSSFKTFSLMNLLNQEQQFTKKTRFIVAQKIIQFYLRKIEKEDFTTQMLQNLLVFNYSPLYPRACIIRKDKSLSTSEEQCNLQRLIWNLGFLLDNLVNQASGPDSKSAAQLSLINLINNIIEENNCDLEDVYELKQLIEEACENFR